LPFINIDKEIKVKKEEKGSFFNDNYKSNLTDVSIKNKFKHGSSYLNGHLNSSICLTQSDV
jgi:hypothetical protein